MRYGITVTEREEEAKVKEEEEEEEVGDVGDGNCDGDWVIVGPPFVEEEGEEDEQTIEESEENVNISTIDK